MRTADGAGIGLCMETSVSRIFIFMLTFRTHLETAHGGQWAVIGNVIDDGETRSTVGAVGECISISSVGFIEDLFSAFGTGS